MNSERILPSSGVKEVQQATGLQDILQVEVICRQVRSLIQGQISSPSEQERCTNVNSNHGYCWNGTAEIGDSIGGYHKYNVEAGPETALTVRMSLVFVCRCVASRAYIPWWRPRP